MNYYGNGDCDYETEEDASNEDDYSYNLKREMQSAEREEARMGYKEGEFDA